MLDVTRADNKAADKAEPRWRREAALGLDDLGQSVKGWHLWLFIAWHDIAQRYRRSIIGPFWLTLSMGIMIFALGMVYSHLFGMPIGDYLPYLTASFLGYGFMSTVILDAAGVFTSAEGFLRQTRIPKLSLVLRLVTRNLIIFAHNFVIYILVMLYFGINPGLAAFVALAGLIMASVTGLVAATFVGLFCTRFRDMPQIVQSIMQVVFFITPVMWKADMIDERVGGMALLVQLNPFAIYLRLIRDPLLGTIPPASVWVSAFVVMLLAILVTVPAFVMFRRRITYWL